MNCTARISPTAAAVLVLLMLSLTGGAAAQSSLFQVENASQVRLLDVTDQAGFFVGGSFDVGTIPLEGAGVRLLWYPRKAAFRAGRVQADQWNDGNIGQWSAAFGQNKVASGTHSVAMNGGTTASGDRSVAMGGGTHASGSFSLTSGQVTVASGGAAVAMGTRSVASGTNAVALGNASQASGLNAVALGDGSVASGANSLATGFLTQATGNVATALGTGTVAAGAASVALGSAVTAQGDGSFVFGDRSTSFAFTAAANTFMVRAFGGIGFNTGVNIGCDLPAGTGAWACTSSRLAKEGFDDVDGESVLAGLAGIRIQRWRYRGTDASHLGPTAEDFHAAFGLGESSTKIAGVDANGVALRAIQALERRTATLQEENRSLRTELNALREQVQGLASPTPGDDAGW